jgi:hypothetical protein
MAYTIGFTFFDLGGFYSAGIPAFTGVLSEVPPLIPTLTAATTPASARLSYPSASDPPTPPGVFGFLHVTDPTGPGDFFRSGPVTAWPPSPANLNVGTGVHGIPFGSIKVSLPMVLQGTQLVVHG